MVRIVYQNGIQSSRLRLAVAGIVLAAMFVSSAYAQTQSPSASPAAGDSSQPAAAAPAQGRANSSADTLPPTQEERRIPNIRAELAKQGRIQFLYARELHSDGYLNASRDRLQNFLELYPDHDLYFEALRELASVLKDMNRTEEAAGVFLRAFRSAHNREKGDLAYLEAGRLFIETGDLERARSIFSELIRSRPSSRVARLAEIEMKTLNMMDSGQDESVENRENETPESEHSAPETDNRESIGEGLEESIVP